VKIQYIFINHINVLKQQQFRGRKQ